MVVIVKSVLLWLSFFLLNFTSLDEDIDLYLDSLTQWKQIESQVKEMQTERRSSRNSRLNVWIEFRGFLHSSLGVRPPDDWMHFLAMGTNHDRPTIGWFGEAVAIDNKFVANINLVDFEVEAHAAFNNGYIRRLDEKGVEVWTAEIFSTKYKQRSPGTGIPPRTIWLNLEMSPDRKRLHVWGFSEYGNCFYQKIDLENGKTLGRLILELPEEIYWEKAGFRKSRDP